jgi:hypothetical protein
LFAPCPLREVVFVGDPRRPEFREAADWLACRCQLHCVATVRSAVLSVERRGAPPDLVVIAQSHPGQFPLADVEALRRVAPLTRVIALCGPWCEGEVRTGHPWPGITRLYWHQFVNRMEAAWADSFERDAWAVPATSTEVERMLALAPTAANRRPVLVAIAAATWTTYDGLASVCTQAGHATIWFPPRQRPFARNIAFGLWDDSLGEAESCHVFTQAIAPAPVLAVLNFPRPEDHRRFRRAGVDNVLAKPFLAGDLLGELSRLATRESAAASQRAA